MVPPHVTHLKLEAPGACELDQGVEFVESEGRRLLDMDMSARGEGFTCQWGVPGHLGLNEDHFGAFEDLGLGEHGEATRCPGSFQFWSFGPRSDALVIFGFADQAHLLGGVRIAEPQESRTQLPGWWGGSEDQRSQPCGREEAATIDALPGVFAFRIHGGC